jgi:hypothetical protein
MRIHAVLGGFNTNDDVQFVELRMNSGGQNVLAGHKLRFLDAAGTQTGEFTFPSPNPGNASTGDSILIATAEYNDDYSPGHDADFEFSLANTTGTSTDNRLHPVQAPNGKVIFEPASASCLGAGPPVDSVTYGTTTVNADWGGPGNKAPALPSPATNQGLRLSNLALTPTNNATEYTLQNASTTSETIASGNLATDFRFPRNNARVLSAMFEPSGVGGTVVEPELADRNALADRQNGDGLPLVSIAGTGAAVLAAAIALSALEVRRRRRT